MRIANQALHDLIDDIYRASTDPEAWQRVVDGVQALIPGTGTNLQGLQSGTQPRHLLVQQGYDATFIGDYREHYAASNPWAALVPQMKVGVPHIITESKFLPQIVKTDFQHFITKNGWGYGLGMPIWTTPDRLFFLVIEYAKRKAEKLNKPAEPPASIFSPAALSFMRHHRRPSVGQARKRRSAQPSALSPPKWPQTLAASSPATRGSPRPCRRR